nr:hypothetical protein Iba_chr11aCG3330 [Ipomoea batatas]
MKLLLRMGHFRLRQLNRRMKRKLKSLLTQIQKKGTVGSSAMSLLVLITSLALIIWMQLGTSEALSIMSTGRDTVLMILQLALFHFLKDINAQLNGLQVGKRYGTIMFHTPSLQRLRDIKTGLKLVVNTLPSLVVGPSLSMVLFTILILYSSLYLILPGENVHVLY